MAKTVRSSTSGAGPAEFPVTPEAVGEALGITDLADGPTLRNKIAAATEAAEAYCCSRFVTQTWLQYFDAFADPLVLDNPPLSSVSSITYVDTSGATQTLSSTKYETGEEYGVGLVRLKYNQSWPTTRSHPDSVCVKFVAGYGAKESVPDAVKQAITLHVGHSFEYPEGEVPLPDTFKQLLGPSSFRRFLEPDV